MAMPHEGRSAGEGPAGRGSRWIRLRALPLVVGIVAVIVSLWLPWLESNTHRIDCVSCGTSVTYTAWQSANAILAPICIGLPLFALSVAAIGLIVQRRLRIAFLMLLVWPALGVVGALMYYLLIGDLFPTNFTRGIVTEDSVSGGAWLCLTGYAIAFIGVLVLIPLYRQHRQRVRSK